MSWTELNVQALSILRKNGWNGTPRNIDIDLEDLLQEGFTLPPLHVLSILREYSGIEFEVIDKKFLTRSVITFGSEKALEVPCIKSDLEEHEIILEKELYPIGSMDFFNADSDISYERMILLVANDGMVYSGRSYVIVQEGYCINDFINRIISNEPLWKLHESLRINYSQRDPRLMNHQKKESHKVN
jgi:SUKH-3 immunity protein